MMQYTSFAFIALFLPAVLLAYYVAPRIPAFRKCRDLKNILLVIASIGFYCMAETRFWFLVPCLMVMNIAAVRAAGCSGRRSWLRWTCVGINLMFLIYCKYISGTFPLGISFFTFLAISYDVDSCRIPSSPGKSGNGVRKDPVRTGPEDSLEKKENVTGARNPSASSAGFWDDALYLCFFASIVTGPITQFAEEYPSLHNRKESRALFLRGLRRFLVGYIKKIAVADILSYLVADAYTGTAASGAGGSPTMAAAWLGAIAYSLQLYYDFSGYSDMAIGMAEMFGIRLAENFNYPYAADSINDFWHRWHMSLTRWFTRYVYIPLGGNRVSERRHFLNLLIVWILTGLWHGNGWTFLLWGMIHFCAQYAEKRIAGHEGTRQGQNRRRSRVFLQIWKRFYTLVIVVTAWSVFQSENLSVAIQNIRAMFHIGRYRIGLADPQFLALLRGYKWPLVCAVLFSFPIVRRFPAAKTWQKCIRTGIVCAVFICCVLSGLGMNYQAALYAGF